MSEDQGGSGVKPHYLDRVLDSKSETNDRRGKGWRRACRSVVSVRSTQHTKVKVEAVAAWGGVYKDAHQRSVLTGAFHACYNFLYMSVESKKPLDTSALQAAYPHEELPSHDRYGVGERYRFGATLADIYGNPPELTPVVQVRMVKGYLALGDVLHVLPTEAGGIHVDHGHGECEIGNKGEVAYVYTAPKPETMLRVSLDGQTHKDVYGRSYTQSSMEVEGTPEGVRVTIYGVVDAAPKPVNNKRGSPLQFFLVEYDPKKPEEPLRHEVWARNKAREEVKGLKLKKDDCIEAVLYRHTWDVELQGGGKQTHTRHNLAKVTKVDRIDSAKRSKTEQSGTREV